MTRTGKRENLKLGPGRERIGLDFHLQNQVVKLFWSLWSKWAPEISRGKGLGLASQH